MLWELLRLAALLGQPLIIVHGDCPSGADRIADTWVHRVNNFDTVTPLRVMRYPAKWDTFGKTAGHMRNSQMVYDGADMCLAFLRDGSHGTTDCITKARAMGIPTHVVEWETPEERIKDSE